MTENAPAWVVLAAAILTLAGSLGVAKLTGRSSERVARAGDEAEFRKSLIERVDQLEGRLEKVEAVSDARLAFINVLENHIWQGKQPPPPARPPGI